MIIVIRNRVRHDAVHSRKLHISVNYKRRLQTYCLWCNAALYYAHIAHDTVRVS